MMKNEKIEFIIKNTLKKENFMAFFFSYFYFLIALYFELTGNSKFHPKFLCLDVFSFIGIDSS
jgi:hypothetical protein